MVAWAEDSELAATVVVRNGRAAGWINLRHCRVEHWPFIWMRLRSMAARTPPVGFIFAEDLVILLHDEHGDRAHGA